MLPASIDRAQYTSSNTYMRLGPEGSMSYKGKITTTGSSEAIRLDKELFKQNPEFKQQAEVRADIIGPGKVLITVLGRPEFEQEEDLIVGAFLSFLENDLRKKPASVTPLVAETVTRAKALTEGVVYTDDDFE